MLIHAMQNVDEWVKPYLKNAKKFERILLISEKALHEAYGKAWGLAVNDMECRA